MSIMSLTFPAGTAIDAPEVEAAIADFVRTMPKNQGYQWLVTVCVYANRTEVLRHAQVHHGFQPFQEATDEPSNPGLLHWRLAAASDLYTRSDLALLRRLER